MTRLAEMQCVPCHKGSEPMSDKEIQAELASLPDWDLVKVDGVPRLRRCYKTKKFADALTLTNRIGEKAEEINHHPVLVTEWGQVTVSWWTHHIGGLHLNDFIMAARSDEAYQQLLP